MTQCNALFVSTRHHRVKLGVYSAIAVIKNSELVESELKHGAPREVVGVVAIKSVGYVGSNVDELNTGGGNGHWSGNMEGVEVPGHGRCTRGGGGGRAGRHAGKKRSIGRNGSEYIYTYKDKALRRAIS